MTQMVNQKKKKTKTLNDLFKHLDNPENSSSGEKSNDSSSDEFNLMRTARNEAKKINRIVSDA